MLGETRTISVYRPSPYGLAADAPLPVRYMPDGGIQEDFLHVAGLVQVLSGNGSMRPFLVVGIENTERRRDMTGAHQQWSDRKIAARVGGSAAFRAFIRNDPMPAIARRYRTTRETAIVGESLAGLFVVETLLVEPALFDTYVASSADGDRNDAAKNLARVLQNHAVLTWTHEAMASETHATIYHPAALRAFRLLFKPEARE